LVTGRRLGRRGCFSLQIDDRRGAMLAFRHLVEVGHRRIAFIAGSETHPDAVERFEGYKKALADAGIDFDPQLVAVGDCTRKRIAGNARTVGSKASSPRFFA